MARLSRSELLTYWEQLETAAEEAGISLLEAFVAAGSSDATFYRARKFANTGEGSSLREETAKNVYKAIIDLKENPSDREERTA